MKSIVIAALVSLFAVGPVAAATSCKEQAAEKKLAGAALNSFMTKCQRDAQASCSASAASRNLAGAAKSSYTKKCVDDTVGLGGGARK
jgi:hypothetical protein